jgi:hypothetical protein
METKKFELAKRSFETASDTLALLNLYVVANYRVRREERRGDEK